MFTIFSPTSILGYGFDEDSLRVMLSDPRLGAVGCDGGSTDAGPYYLGSGAPFSSNAAVENDLERMLEISYAKRSPCILGTCGGSGTDGQLESTWEMVRGILARRGLSAKVALIRSEVDSSVVEHAIETDSVSGLDGFSPLTLEDVSQASRIVAMMGVEPVIAALDGGADIVLAGRISDAAIFAAPAIRAGVEPGPAWCAGKLLECGAACAAPFALDSMAVEHEGGDSFLVEPPNPRRRCTRDSIAGMLLHENANPFVHREAGGTLDLTGLSMSSAGPRAMRLSGARFISDPTYRVKLEGVAARGHRIVVLGATHDPRVIARIDSYLQNVESTGRARLAARGIDPSRFTIFWRVYGRDGVLGPLERQDIAATSAELAVALEVVADCEDMARTVASTLRSLLVHTDFPGRQCTEGSFALPFSPAELDGSAAYEFVVWHVMELSDPLQLFPIDYRDAGGGTSWQTE
jgi:hypothetical protein